MGTNVAGSSKGGKQFTLRSLKRALVAQHSELQRICQMLAVCVTIVP